MLTLFVIALVLGGGSAAVSGGKSSSSSCAPPAPWVGCGVCGYGFSQTHYDATGTPCPHCGRGLMQAPAPVGGTGFGWRR